MKTKHTPGPWRVSDKYRTSIASEYYPSIATAWDGEIDTELEGLCPFIEEARANARLIAAAPDLLSALENLITIITTERDTPGDICDAAVVSAQKAIEKAKGENI